MRPKNEVIKEYLDMFASGHTLRLVEPESKGRERGYYKISPEDTEIFVEALKKLMES